MIKQVVVGAVVGLVDDGLVDKYYMDSSFFYLERCNNYLGKRHTPAKNIRRPCLECLILSLTKDRRMFLAGVCLFFAKVIVAPFHQSIISVRFLNIDDSWANTYTTYRYSHLFQFQSFPPIHFQKRVQVIVSQGLYTNKKNIFIKSNGELMSVN